MQVFGVLVLPAPDASCGAASRLLQRAIVLGARWTLAKRARMRGYGLFAPESRLMPKANFSGQPGGSAFELRVNPARALLRPSREDYPGRH